MLRNRGFGLIELVIVIAILGILTGLVLAGVSISRDRSLDVRVKSGIRQLRIVADEYALENGESFDGFAGCVGTPNLANCGSQSTADSIAILIADIEAANASSNSVSASSSAAEFCVAAPLKSASGNFVCADSNGETFENASSLSPCTGSTTCLYN